MLRAITEALESVASTEARVAIVVRALGRSGLAKVPERGPELIRFVDGPLRDAIQELLGAEIADELVAQLKPVLRFAARPPSIQAPRPPSIRSMAAARTRPPASERHATTAPPPPRARTQAPTPTSTARSSQGQSAPTLAPAQGQPEQNVERRPTIPVGDLPRDERPTMPPAERPGAAGSPAIAAPRVVELPRVSVEGTPASASGTRSARRLPAARTFLVATLDDALASAAEQVVSAHVRIVRGLFELVDALEDLGDQDAALVHDCTSPAVHVASLLALSADLPERISVVLLGPSPLDLEALATSPERTSRWLQVERLTPAELASSIAIAGAPPMPSQSAPSSSIRR